MMGEYQEEERAPLFAGDEEDGINGINTTIDQDSLDAKLLQRERRWQWRALVMVPLTLSGFLVLLCLGAITYAAMSARLSGRDSSTAQAPPPLAVSSQVVAGAANPPPSPPAVASKVRTTPPPATRASPQSPHPPKLPVNQSSPLPPPPSSPPSSAFHGNVSLFRHSQVPDPNCPHFITHRLVTDAGIGHLIAEYITGMALTHSKPGATYVYRNDLASSTWEGHLEGRGGGAHGDVAWAEDFFRLGLGEADYDEVMEKHKPEVITYGNSPCDGDFMHRCNALCNWWGYLCEWQDGAGTVGVNHLCISRFHQAFDEMKHIMRYKFRHTLYQPQAPLLFRPDRYNVAWHLRTGDVTIHGNEPQWFREVARQVMLLLEGFDTSIHFFSESPGSRKGQPPPGFDFLKEEVVGVGVPCQHAVFVNHLDAKATLYHFANADMVVTSGSSFSFLTGLISPKPVIVEAVPKEGSAIDFYQIEESIKLNTNGTIVGKSLDVARSEVVDMYELYHTVRVPPSHAEM